MATTIVRHSSHPIEIRTLARESAVHPDLVRRFVALGLLEPGLPPEATAWLAKAARLRRDLGLDWAGAVLACELLARIDELERRLSRYEPR
jgi:alkylation response protein AidB-like acyl-CoA dehydrogenase